MFKAILQIICKKYEKIFDKIKSIIPLMNVGIISAETAFKSVVLKIKIINIGHTIKFMIVPYGSGIKFLTIIAINDKEKEYNNFDLQELEISKNVVKISLKDMLQ